MTVSRQFHFSAGHRVHRHESKCAHVHGHNYVAVIEVGGELDQLQRVIDFGILKSRIGKWIDTYWDHGFIMSENDRDFSASIKQTPAFGKVFSTGTDEPTAETLARILCEITGNLLDPLRVVSVRIWETVNCYADYRP